eukprot:2461326-Rhodomonas_salina.1
MPVPRVGIDIWVRLQVLYYHQQYEENELFVAAYSRKLCSSGYESLPRYPGTDQSAWLGTYS